MHENPIIHTAHTRSVLFRACASVFFIVLLPVVLYLYLSQPKDLFFSEQTPPETEFNLGTQHIPQLIKKMQRIVIQNPDDVQGWYLLGRLCFSATHYSCAVESFAHAHQLKPQHALISLQYAQSLYYQNDHQLNSLSKKLLQHILSKNPADPAAHNLLAIASFEQHDYDGARKHWNIAQKNLEPGSANYQAITTALDNVKRIQS